MMYAVVLTEWVGNGSRPGIDTDLRARVNVDHAIIECVDVTQQSPAILIPSPNLLLAGVTCTEEVLAGIEADPNCRVYMSEVRNG